MQVDNKKLLFIIDNLGSGGAQRQLTNLAVGLKQKGHQVDIFCYANGDHFSKTLEDEGIKIHWSIKRSRYSPDIILNLQRFIRENGFDLAVSFLTTPNFYNILGGRFSFHRIPVIVSERFCDLPQGISTTEKVVRQFYRFANHVVVNSHHQRENFLRKYPWLKGRITTIYNGYDLNFFSPSQNNTENNHLRLLTIASISPYKNGLVMVEALRILRERYQLEPHVAWIGRRFNEGDYALYVRDMEERIDRYGIRDQWHWMGERKDIVDQLHSHDALVHPSYGEGLPNVVCEALSCARPVIVSDTLDHPNLVQDGVSGLLFDWRDPENLAERIKTFSDLSPEEKKEMGKQGRKYAQTNLAMERFISEYEALFARVLSQ